MSSQVDEAEREQRRSACRLLPNQFFLRPSTAPIDLHMNPKKSG